jgi:hypothetical protein
VINQGKVRFAVNRFFFAMNPHLLLPEKIRNHAKCNMN